MAEIKSTLDLVMEKTRHLRLSRSEKKEQEKDAFTKKLSGLLQRYADGALDRDYFGEEFQSMGRQFDVDVKQILKNEILNRLTLEGSNSRLMTLLKDFCGIDTEKLNTLNGEYQAEIEAAAQKRAAEIKAALEKNQRISGDAVIPNLDADSRWHSEVERIRMKFVQLLGREKSVLKASEY